MKDIVSQIKGLSADTRDIKRGYLFAALKGTRFDGVDFIDQAVLNGAIHVLAPTGTKIEGAQLIESDNPRLDFAKLASAFYQSQPDNIVAVTGTNGKTSVADFIRQIFEMLNLKSASLGTLGLVSKHAKGYNVMTTPDPVQLHALLADLKGVNVNYLAMEASSHGLDQYRLDGLTPKVAAFTNLSQDHLDYHGDMDTYFKAKERLFTDILSNDGVAVVNSDDKYGQRIKHSNMIYYGFDKDADLKIISQKPSATGQDIQIQYGDDIHNIHLPLIGLFQAYNVLCAAACCIGLGLNKNDVFKCLPKLVGVKGRVELASAINDRAAYIDYDIGGRADAIAHAVSILNAGDVLLVAGKGHEQGQTIGKITHPFDDLTITRDLMEKHYKT